MKTPTITIDMDEKCRECGKPGTTATGGVCLDCAAKHILANKRKAGPKMIDRDVLQEATAMIQRHLLAHEDEIAEAFENGEGEASVSVSLKFFRALKGTIRIQTKMSATTNKVVEKDERIVTPKQAPLEFKKAGA